MVATRSQTRKQNREQRRQKEAEELHELIKKNKVNEAVAMVDKYDLINDGDFVDALLYRVLSGRDLDSLSKLMNNVDESVLQASTDRIALDAAAKNDADVIEFLLIATGDETVQKVVNTAIRNNSLKTVDVVLLSGYNQQSRFTIKLELGLHAGLEMTTKLIEYVLRYPGFKDAPLSDGFPETIFDNVVLPALESGYPVSVLRLLDELIRGLPKGNLDLLISAGLGDNAEVIDAVVNNFGPWSESDMGSVLCGSIKTHSLEMIKYIIKNRPDVSTIKRYGEYTDACLPLIGAVHSGAEILKIVLSSESSDTSFDGFFPFYAMLDSNAGAESFRLLLSRTPITDEFKNSGIFGKILSVNRGDDRLEMLRLMVEVGAAITDDGDIVQIIKILEDSEDVDLLKLFMGLPSINFTSEPLNGIALDVAARAGDLGLLNDILALNRVDGQQALLPEYIADSIKIAIDKKHQNVFQLVKTLLEYGGRAGFFEAGISVLGIDSENPRILKLLLRYDLDFALDHAVLRTAIAKGSVLAARIILNATDQDNFTGSDIVQLAVRSRSDDMLDLVLRDGRADPGEGNNIALTLASELGLDEQVRMLLDDPRVDPTANSNSAILAASHSGFTNIIDRLLRDIRVDPTDDDNHAIMTAYFMERDDALDMLIKNYKVFDSLASDVQAIPEEIVDAFHRENRNRTRYMNLADYVSIGIRDAVYHDSEGNELADVTRLPVDLVKYIMWLAYGTEIAGTHTTERQFQQRYQLEY